MKTIKLIMMAMLMAATAVAFSSCDKDDDDDGDTVQLEGVQGKWFSSGDNIAPLLANPPFNTDSIFAEFKTDMTFHVESYDNDGVMTLFTGVYTQQPSNVGSIWTINLTQNAPSAGASQGIFQVFANETPNRLLYEILQTEPALGLTPPTPEGGFGSTHGGAFGNTNIQTFLRITE